MTYNSLVNIKHSISKAWPNIADIATSRIGSAAQGYVELYGRASVNPENLIRRPLSGMSCIWFRCKLYSKK
jgi:hypothetical protein